MRGAAKMVIERELATLPLEELPFDEVRELVTAIRDRCYAPTFKRQAQEAEHQNAEHEARHRKEMEEMAASRRADRWKTTLIDQAIGQVRAKCVRLSRSSHGNGSGCSSTSNHDSLSF
jgi:hypothetical protein